MSAKLRPRRIKGVDPDAGRVDDPEDALERLRAALKRILKVPKSSVQAKKRPQE